MRILLPLAALGAIALPSVAQAADVKVITSVVPPSCSKCGDGGNGVSTAFYTAAPGEANDVSVTRVAGGLVFRDAGAPLAAGDACAAQGDGSVRCTAASATVMTVLLGDGDDRFDASLTTGGSYVGGDGNDTVVGGPGQDTFSGGSGDDAFDGGGGADSAGGGAGKDTLTGGADQDNLNGGSQDDVLRGGDAGDNLQAGPGADQAFGDAGDDQLFDDDTLGAPEADVLDGGAGSRDIVRFDGRVAPVTVDLSKPGSPAGEAGESNSLAGIEGAYGGRGVDRLTGDDGPNQLSGVRAVIDARGGDDTISSTTGVVTCGDGSDVLYVGGFEPVKPDCERIGGLDVAIGRPVVTKKTVTVRLTCPRSGFAFSTGCTLAGSAGTRGAFGKSGALFLKAGKTGSLVWRLTPAGRVAVKAHQPVTFRMLVRGGGAEAAVHATIRFAIAT